MEVNRIQNISFKEKEPAFIEKKHFLSEKARANAEKLLWQMNHETEYMENKAGTGFTSYILASLYLDKKHKFVDNRMYSAPTDNPKEYKCDCSLYMGKNRIDINSKTGEIVGKEKSMFKSWRSLLDDAESYIKTFIENFNDKSIVRKNKFGIQGYTEKGYQILQKYI